MDNKYFKLIALCILLISLGYWAYILVTNEKEVRQDISTSTPTSTSEQGEELSYSIQYKEMNESASNSEISIRYPHLVGKGESISQINRTIKREIDSIRSSFKQNLQNGVPLPENSSFKNGLVIQSGEAITEGQVNGNKIISIPLSLSEYFAGAAHPNNALLTYNFNLETGEKVSLREIVNRDDYLQYLSNESRRALQNYSINGEKIELDPSMVQTGTSPQEKNFSQFLLDGDSLILVFNPYQVAPYVVGVVKIGIKI